jgi:hypothetical protein
VAVTAGCAYLGKIVADLAVAVALGGDCLADAAMLRAEPALFGPVASGRVISRLISRLAGNADAALTALGTARAAARQRRRAHAGRRGAPMHPAEHQCGSCLVAALDRGTRR